jgi:hypothetical protein
MPVQKDLCINVARGARWGFYGVLRRGKKLPVGNIG